MVQPTRMSPGPFLPDEMRDQQHLVRVVVGQASARGFVIREVSVLQASGKGFAETVDQGEADSVAVIVETRGKSAFDVGLAEAGRPRPPPAAMRLLPGPWQLSHPVNPPALEFARWIRAWGVESKART